MSEIISTLNLTKHFPSVKALTGCTLKIKKQQVVGLLGPNGSGKSTLVRLLLGFLTPTAGKAEILNLDCTKQRVDVHRHVAYLPGDARMFRTMRGKDVFEFFASIRGHGYKDRAIAISKRLDLDLSRWVAFMSTGMRQKLALSVIMAMDTPVLILDEPTANLDPTVRQEVLELVQESQDRGTTVVFSSHVLPEIEEICDRVVILRSGELVHQQAIGNQDEIDYTATISTADKAPLLPTHLQQCVNIVPGQKHGEFDLTIRGDVKPALHWLAEQSFDKINLQPINLRSIYNRFHQTDR
ncbi:MAG: ABC transporter ATP-binding protein [Planctomycetota bacterium]